VISRWSFEAIILPGSPTRRLTSENHHQSSIGVYLVNCLEPGVLDIQITAQNRNYNQSFFQVKFTSGNVVPVPSGWWEWLGWSGNLGG
jgi:hypothetical protein